MQLAFKYDYLMNMILCIAARHLAVLQPEDTTYPAAAAGLLGQALSQFGQELSNDLVSAHVDAFIATAFLLQYEMWNNTESFAPPLAGAASPEPPGDRLFTVSSSLKQAVLKSLGPVSKLSSVFLPHMSCDPQPLLAEAAQLSSGTLDTYQNFFSYERPLSLELLGIPPPTMQDMGLVISNSQQPSNSEIQEGLCERREAYASIITRLCLLLSFLPEVQPPDSICGKSPLLPELARFIFTFPVRCHGPFTAMIEERDPHALLLLYHFYRAVVNFGSPSLALFVHPQALELSDSQRCKNEATNANGLFCNFHARQVFALYKGYKRRNARLDALENEAPPYLKIARVALANDNFDTLDDEKTLREVHSHLFDKYVLLGKIIDARKLHHKHFYSLKVDYGHQAYLDKLISERFAALQALGRLEKRTAKVLYEKEQWFNWVREIQDDEEATRDKEQKKLKLEAALFRRNWKQMQGRLERKRKKEEKRRQDAYLENAYQQRLAMDMDESEDDMSWDPIEDLAEDGRDRYIDLIKNFLWMDASVPDDDPTPPIGLESQSAGVSFAGKPPLSKRGQKKARAKMAAKEAKATNSATSEPKETKEKVIGHERLLAIQEGTEDAPSQTQEPDKSNIETEEEMRKRLREGVEKNMDDIWGIEIVGTIENPHETHKKTAPMMNDEIESAVKDIEEIKLLLFCRLLLAKASLLPAAIRASSVEQFLSDAELSESDLRDLCLKVEKPSLQEIRDACADFARGDEVDDVEVEVEDEEDESFEDLLREDRRYDKLHSRNWLHDNIVKQVTGDLPQKKSKDKSTKTKVTICGKTLWNHSSEKAMSRDGWLQFSIMAKDCDLKDAIQLCRNWAEFSDLNLLTLWQHFPASNWASWGSNRLIQQLQELGVFPYFLDFDAQRHSRHNQVGGRTRGRRQHDFVETRNVLAAHMKRNDPVTRRFLQYLVMRAGEVLVLVRDGKTGRVITAPPEEQLWTYRKKQGLGRASKSEWDNYLEVGPDYFALTDRLREWRLGFDDYYDVFMWDFVPDQPSINMYNIVIAELRNAWRITQPQDAYLHMEPLLRTLTRETKTMRTRHIKEGEKVKSLWDTLTDQSNQYKLFEIKDSSYSCRDGSEVSQSPYMFYNKANVVEDEVLFPDESTSTKSENVPFRQITNGASGLETGVLPSAIRYLAKGLAALQHGEDPMAALDAARDTDEDSLWALPNIWTTGLRLVHQEGLTTDQKQLLRRTGLAKIPKSMSTAERMRTSDGMEIMERDRAFGFKKSFHAGDLEPGSTQRFSEVQDKIASMLKFAHSGPTDWVWFLAHVLDWLNLRADYKDYVQDPGSPWPHGFIAQDLVAAYAAMAMFFPELSETAAVTKYLASKECRGFKGSVLFDPKERSKTRPDRRTRTSYKYRSKSFWDEWNKTVQSPRYFTDIYPMDWSLAIRPIIAHLYRAGVIAPAYLQADPAVVSGTATANTEPHRPGKLDLFIDYTDRYDNFPQSFPPTFVSPSQWPDLLPLVNKYAAAHSTARFALMRLWSAPHFYPNMVGLPSRQGTSFLDSAGRSWEWRFVPKDMPASEFSAHRVTGMRLELLKRQFGTDVVNRGDLILVMAEDAKKLLRLCTAVTFAIQTKPWLREVDLWKSFVNVDAKFINGLDRYWLD
ncbi:hypothetical protein G7046_g3593 [Stylonectria norvegica]|nr:hypothetical protein G7046_g3593 [Stylonectria norvegica]